jgi:5-formyltetrahydrofolate cyclo-ligase
VNKSRIRSKILRLRKNNFNKNFKISSDKFFSFLRNNKYNLDNLGGYYPSNFEIDDLEILELLEKKNYKIS